ncbi:MAG: RHS repeat-associated core domain-containing protein, partial [Bacteroidota bacterium]
DGSGNMTGDLNRSILVGYNHLNKPTFVEKGANAGITYIYSADGTKLRQKVHDFSSAPMGRPSNSQSQVLDPNTVTKITDYVGLYQYEDADGNATQVDKQLIQFQHAKGRATWDGSEFYYQYNLTDHLGNVRVVFQDGDKDGRVNPDPIAGQDVVQVIQGYYPFGMSHSGSFATTTSPENQYLYNGKEKQDELNLGWYDYGARMYDASIGRWNGVDALAEEYLPWSPYNYVTNNPLLYIDPDGNKILIYYVDDNEKIQSIDYEIGMEANTGNIFADEVIKGLNFLSNSNNKDILQSVVDHSNETKIEYTDDDEMYRPEEGVIGIDPLSALEMPFIASNGNNISPPVAGLAHELDHANQYNKLKDNLEKAIKESSDPKRDPTVKAAKKALREYRTNNEELRVIKGSETDLALENNYGRRNKHDQGFSTLTDGILSTKPTKRKDLRKKIEELRKNKIKPK